MLKKTKNRRKTSKPQLVNKRQSVKELTEHLEIDHFLIDEQIFYADQLKQQLKENEKKIEPLVKGLDNRLQAEPVKQAAARKMDKILIGSGIKVSLTKSGQQVDQNNRLTDNSVFTLDLRKEQAAQKEPIFFKPKESSLYREFKISRPTFDLPAPTFLKRRWFKTIREKLKIFTGIFKYRWPIVFHHHQHQASKASLPWLWRLKMALNFALVALLFIVPIKGYLFYQQAREAKGKVLGVTEEAFADFSQGLKSATDADWANAALSFNQSVVSFGEAQKTIVGFNQSVVSFLENLPLTSQKVEQGRDLLAAGELFSRAAAIFSEAVLKLNQNQGASGLPIIQNALNLSLADLKLALQKIGAVSPSLIPEEQRENFILLQKNMPLLLENLNHLNDLVDLSLQFLGYDEPKRYLFVFQNQNELRGTGGFLGSYALVDLRKGEIANLEVPGGGFYDLKGNFFEKIIAPEPMHLLGTPWMIWDANWWPDFSASMKKLLWFYEKSGGPSVDGVVAFNAQVLSEILKLTGNITLIEYGQVFTPETVVLALQHETEFEYDKEQNRPKAIIGDLMKVLVERLTAVSQEQLMPLLLTLQDNLEKKDIQLYFIDEALQQRLRAFGWSGEVSKSPKDYLLVTRTNVAGGKTDGVIKQAVKHYAYLQPDGSIIDTTAVTLTHQGNPEDVFEKVLNKSYVRVYVPQGSVLLEASGYDAIDPALFKEIYPGYQPDKDLFLISGQTQIDPKTNTRINNEFNKTVFGNWLLLQPGEEKTLTFSYRLPFKLDFTESKWEKLLVTLGINEPSLADSYGFLVQKQSGVVNSSLESRLYLPVGLNIVWSKSTGQQPVEFKENYVQFSTTLDKDYSYGVLLKNR